VQGTTTDCSLQEYIEHEAAVAAAAVATTRVCGNLAGIASSLSALQQQVQQHATAIAPAGTASVQIRTESPTRSHLARLPQQQQQQQQQQQVWHYPGQAEGQGPLELLAQQHPERSKSPAWRPVGLAAAAARAVAQNQEYAEATATAISRGNSPSRAAAVSRGNSPGRTTSQQQHQQQQMLGNFGLSGSRGGRVAAMGRGTSSSSGGGIGAAGARGSSSSRCSSPVKLAAGVQTQLAGFQERLMQLQNRLHSAARPWRQQEHSSPWGGTGSAGTAAKSTFSPNPVSAFPVSAFSPTTGCFGALSALNPRMGSGAAVTGPTQTGHASAAQLTRPCVGPSTAVVVKPQSPEAVAVASPTAPWAGSAPGVGNAWGYGGGGVSPSAAAAAVQADWRVVGQPRKSALVPHTPAVAAAGAEQPVLAAAQNVAAVCGVPGFK
jgi:hypothetical protein